MFMLNFIYASSLQDNTKSYNILYKKAVKVFKNKNYKESVNLFNQLFDIKGDDSRVNFYLGRSYFELKEYESAIGAYTRILITTPESIRTKLEVARCYYSLKMYADAKIAFTEIQKEKIPKSVRKNITKYLVIINEKLKKHTFGGIFIAGIMYESNINNRADSNDFYIPKYANINNGIFDNSTVKESDIAHQEILLFNHTYNMSDKQLLKNDFMVFVKKYKDNNSKNIVLLSYSPTIAVTYSKQLQVDYSIFMDTLWYGSKHQLSTYGIYPKFKYLIDKKNEFSGYLKYQVKNNEQKASINQDSSVAELNMNLKYQWLPTTNLNPSFTYARQRKQRGILTNIDNNVFTYSLNLTHMYSPKITLSPKITYQKTNYIQTDPMYFKVQKNTQTQYSISTTYLLDSKWIMQNVINYTNNDSNIISSNYDKYSVTFNFIKQFKVK